MSDFKNVQPLDSFDWEEFENGASAGINKADLEKAYNEDMLPKGILGLNADYVNQYVMHTFTYHKCIITNSYFLMDLSLTIISFNRFISASVAPCLH